MARPKWCIVQCTERSRINNADLKVKRLDAAMGLLVEGEDHENLAGTKGGFGYLFDIDHHGFEALFRITTDKTMAYFARRAKGLCG